MLNRKRQFHSIVEVRLQYTFAVYARVGGPMIQSEVNFTVVWVRPPYTIPALITVIIEYADVSLTQ